MKPFVCRRSPLLLVALAAAGLAGVQAAPGDLDSTFGTGGKVVTDPFSGPASEDTITSLRRAGKGLLVAAGYTGPVPNYDLALARYRNNGSLDPTFGTGGKVKTDLGADEFAESLIVLNGGAVAVAGGTTGAPTLDFLVARYRRNGSLATGFGTDGATTTDFGGDDYAWAIARQKDGRLVVAGETENGDSDLALARYQADGSLDPDFGAAGKVITDLDMMEDESAFDVQLQENGRILIAGVRRAGGEADFLLARYLANGDPDPDFGAGTGWVAIDFGGDDFGHNVAVQKDGRILIAGASDANGSSDFAVARVDAQGTLDLDFGMGGQVLTPIGDYDGADSIRVQKDGRILAAGRAEVAGNFNFAVVRYLEDGTPDDTFGNAGVVHTDINGEFDGIFGAVVQQKRRLAVAGVTRQAGMDRFALARYLLK
jgi:uncharacterized delta-60 repeat protein